MYMLRWKPGTTPGASYGAQSVNAPRASDRLTPNGAGPRIVRAVAVRLGRHRIAQGPLAAGCAALAVMLVPLATARPLVAAEGDSTALTIYSSATPGSIPPEIYQPTAQSSYRGGDLRHVIPGYALVKHERQIELKAGRGTVRFTDVAAQIDPTTVSFASLTDPKGTRVLEQNYEFDLVSTEKLMQRYLDREITVDQVQGDKVATFKGTLLSTAGGLLLKAADGGVQVVNNYANVRFPDLPGGLITKPTLVWDVVADKAGAQKVRLTYETKAMAWWADYNIVFAPGADANQGVLDVGAWVSIVNQSGATYPDARLKLIAGDVHRAPQPQPQYVGGKGRRQAMAAMDMEEGFEEKAFFEYHLYTLGRPTTLPDNSTKQIELFPAARGVPCEKVLVYYGLGTRYPVYGSPMTDRNFGVQTNKKVDIYLQFKNEEKVGMGMPLPAGRIRVSQLDTADGSLEFVGEDAIDHTPKDEEVLIKLGSAFDVVGERVQADFKIDSRRDTMEETVEIKLRNHKEEPVKVIAKENLYRWTNWKITEKTHEFEKIDSRTIHFPVTVPKDAEVAIRYTVVYTW
ncbi:MAG: DUF4139 domain-containing protein [Planctomycetes bacterium]|nr:DUF4139 domain-containing protein [Planctomycetota bacterium]